MISLVSVWENSVRMHFFFQILITIFEENLQQHEGRIADQILRVKKISY